jgi:hypothetical protein
VKLRRRIALRLDPSLNRALDVYEDEYGYDEFESSLTAKASLHKRALSQVMRWGRRQKPGTMTVERGDGAYNYTQIVDMSKAITTLDPDMSQFTTMLLRATGRRATDEAKYSWIEDNFIPRSRWGWFAGSWMGDFEWGDDWELESDRRAQWYRERDAAIAFFAPRITVADGQGTRFFAGDLIRNAKTGEVLKVTAIDNDVMEFER